MIEIIKKKLNGEKFLGIIPINPKRLKIKFANKSFSTGFGQWIVIFFICLLPAMFLFGFFGFILGDAGVSKYSLIILFILIFGGLMYLIEKIYVNSIKKYPFALLVITKSDLYFFTIKNDKIEISHKFDTNIENLNEILYGEINKQTKKIGDDFQIKQDGKILLSGKLNIINNNLISKNIEKEYLFSIDKLQNIYLS